MMSCVLFVGRAGCYVSRCFVMNILSVIDCLLFLLVLLIGYVL